MEWNQLNSIHQLSEIDQESKSTLVLIFKHSITCGISATALNRIERNWQQTDSSVIKPYYLDLLNHRAVSNAIENHYKIEHQSPQVLVIKNGKCIYTTTHNAIRYDDLLEEVLKQQVVMK